MNKFRCALAFILYSIQSFNFYRTVDVSLALLGTKLHFTVACAVTSTLVEIVITIDFCIPSNIEQLQRRSRFCDIV